MSERFDQNFFDDELEERELKKLYSPSPESRSNVKAHPTTHQNLSEAVAGLTGAINAAMRKGDAERASFLRAERDRSAHALTAFERGDVRPAIRRLGIMVHRNGLFLEKASEEEMASRIETLVRLIGELEELKKGLGGAHSGRR